MKADCTQELSQVAIEQYSVSRSSALSVMNRSDLQVNMRSFTWLTENFVLLVLAPPIFVKPLADTLLPNARGVGPCLEQIRRIRPLTLRWSMQLQLVISLVNLGCKATTGRLFFLASV